MKKFTDFIVNKRNIILIIFIILSIISFLASKKVKINYDIAEYLPATSETRIGMNIMEEEFAGTETSSFNLMFKGLTETEKTDIFEELKSIDNISDVDYDETENYNKDDYTLYVITVDEDADSEIASNVFNEVTEKYQDYEYVTSGSISDRNKPILETWVKILAVACALVILIIMCDSYAEPFLFLISILMAVLLNKGTNIIFGTISSITSSISAILQLALSMDYSIMLMNRYNQEKGVKTDKIEAMKDALYKSFKSISSSSVTTIVGLIVLVFMSFTIGRDLGLVLAKGVLFSLICIFFVLPSLILMFDKLIVKTKKKSLNIKLNKLGKFSYKIRYVSIPLFLIVFIGSYLLKGNLNIAYTQTEADEVAKIFTENNQIAIIYKNEDEEKIAELLDSIDNEDKIDEVKAYSNTINEELLYSELNEKLNDLGSDVEIEDYVLKILYYHYYNQEINNTMTFEEFIKFIEEEIYDNDNLKDNLTDEEKTNIERLKNFVTEENINKKRNAQDIAKILDIDEDKIDDIFVYYASKNNESKMTINEFISFMNNYVLKNEKYANKVDASAKNNINKLSKYINKNTIQSKMTYKEMADLFGIDESVSSELYKYYISLNEIDTTLTIYEFANFVISDVLINSEYSNNFNDEMILNIKLLQTFSNKETISTEMNSNSLSNLFGINEENVEKVLLLKYMSTDNGNKYSLNDFILQTVYLKNNTTYLDGIDISNLETLYAFAKNENNINQTKLSKAMLAKMFNGIKTNFVENIYLLAGLPDEYTMTPQEFITLVINITNSDEEGLDVSAFTLDSETSNKLKLFKLVIDNSLQGNKVKYNSEQISNILGIEKSQIIQLYGLMDYINGNTTNWESTPYEFVNIIIKNIDNENVKNNIDSQTINKLNLCNSIMTSSLNDTKYTYDDIANFIGIDSSMTKKIYALYVSQNETIKLSPIEFVNFVLNHKNDDTLNGKINDNTLSNLELIKKVMKGVIDNKQYSSSDLASLLNIDSENLKLLYGLYSVKYQNNSINLSLKEFVSFLFKDVVTNNDYSSNFNNEQIEKLNTINSIMNETLNRKVYTADEMFLILGMLTNTIEKDTIEILYTYYGSEKEYDDTWKLTIEQFVTYLNKNILVDSRFNDFIKEDMRNDIKEAQYTVNDAKELLVGEKYSRLVINSKFLPESNETFDYIQKLKDILGEKIDDFYIIGDSPMAYEMSQTFNDELNFITLLTMLAIFIVVAITFKSLIIPLILVFIIQAAVYVTMGFLAISGTGVYFIALLIVQSILMGATIDYAILYSSYYIEHRKTMDMKEAIIESYNKSIHTILTSASILILVTLIVANFASAIAAKICKTISEGTICSTILILLLLPAMIACFDKFFARKNKIK